jgi:hypothetical protein
MSNDELENQLNILKELDSELKNLDKKVNELVQTEKISEKIHNCDSKTKAELNWACSYGIYTNYYLYLMLNEINPKDHQLNKELIRLFEFQKKINNAVKGEKDEEEEVKNNKNKKKDKKVIEKMLRNILNGKH